MLLLLCPHPITSFLLLRVDFGMVPTQYLCNVIESEFMAASSPHHELLLGRNAAAFEQVVGEDMLAHFCLKVKICQSVDPPAAASDVTRHVFAWLAGQQSFLLRPCMK